MKKVLFSGLLWSIASITFAQRQMQVWQNGVPTSFAVAEVDSITFEESYNAQLIGDWREITYFKYTMTISDSLMQVQGREEDTKYTASKNQLHVERLWLYPDDPTYFADLNYSIKGDTLHIDNYERSLVSTYPASYMKITLVRIKQ